MQWCMHMYSGPNYGLKWDEVVREGGGDEVRE